MPMSALLVLLVVDGAVVATATVEKRILHERVLVLLRYVGKVLAMSRGWVFVHTAPLALLVVLLAYHERKR